MSISEKLQKAISESLPQIAAGELKTFIEQAQKDSDALLSATKQISILLDRLKAFEAKEAMHNDLESRQRKLTEDQEKVKNDQRDLKCDKLQYQLEEAKARSSDLFNLVALLVKNPRAIEFMSSFESQAGYSANGQYIQPSPISRVTHRETFETKDSGQPMPDNQ